MCQEEPLFTALVQKRFRKELNTALTDAQEEALGRDEIAIAMKKVQHTSKGFDVT